MNYQLCVIGGGAGGLAAARTGVRLGKRTVLIQDGRIGGDCTFTGCVPSKTLIESVSQGLTFEQSIMRLEATTEQIASTEDAETLESEGITVIQGRASFAGPKVLLVETNEINANRIVVATGSRAVAPPIPGLENVNYLTNENVFSLKRLPKSLIVLGGGAIGCELAQVFCRFGSQVHILEAASHLLPREEPEARVVIANALTNEGIKLHLGVKAVLAEKINGTSQVRVTLDDGSTLESEQLLVAVGRRPTTEGLDASKGNISLDDRGYIKTNSTLRTSSKDTYAVGDVTGKLPFTHAADEMGRIAARNAFKSIGLSRFETQAIPWVTFTDPEVARVGISESEAATIGAKVAYLPLKSVDRAVIANRTEGFVKLIAGSRPLLGNAGGGKLIGATIVAPRAGEMIHEVALAMRTGMFTGRLAQTVHAYPTWSTAIRQAAAQFFFEIDGLRARDAKIT